MARKKEIEFTKMEASGNDFIIIDNRENVFSRSLASIARRLCQRKISVGADGLIVLESSKKYSYRMRIFNPDGSEPQMCGNGARCLAMYALQKKIVPRRAIIETKAGPIGAVVRGERVKIRMTTPKDLKTSFVIQVNSYGRQEVSFINTGVPHAVIFVRNLEKVNVEDLGRRIRYHRNFAPEGTNVDFVKVTGKNSLYIRTYERGVEGETLACGTGAVASAVISFILGKVSRSVEVHTRGGEVLRVECKKGESEKDLGEVWLEGKVRAVYTGKILL